MIALSVVSGQPIVRAFFFRQFGVDLVPIRMIAGEGGEDL